MYVCVFFAGILEILKKFYSQQEKNGSAKKNKFFLDPQKVLQTHTPNIYSDIFVIIYSYPELFILRYKIQYKLPRGL
jgi:hypothetical protein